MILIMPKKRMKKTTSSLIPIKLPTTKVGMVTSPQRPRRPQDLLLALLFAMQSARPDSVRGNLGVQFGDFTAELVNDHVMFFWGEFSWESRRSS